MSFQTQYGSLAYILHADEKGFEVVPEDIGVTPKGVIFVLKHPAIDNTRKHLKPSSEVKHGKDNGWIAKGIRGLKSISELNFFPETGHNGVNICFLDAVLYICIQKTTDTDICCKKKEKENDRIFFEI